jgi:F-type H+-transporting ATPase subunit epsilon
MIDLKIITIEGVFYSGQVSEIILPTETGQIAVLPHHIPLISALKEGIVTLKIIHEEKEINISSGVLEVRAESIAYILVDHASDNV